MVKMHILIAIPTPEYSQADFALGNLQDIISHTHKTFPDWKITTAYKYGTRTDANRNHILKEALADGTVDYILWLDADMLYPAAILERYFEAANSLNLTIDVMGCLYFKRSYPYDPIAYVYNHDENRIIKPYKTILPSAVKHEEILEVDGLGYGGLLVNMKVYEKLGDAKWTVYGKNFHLPFEAEDHLTHDLVFCGAVKKAGMSIKLHGGVRPGHFCLHPVTIDDWMRATEDTFSLDNAPRVLVVMPATNEKMATDAANIMSQRAGAPCDVAVVMDTEHKGFVHMVNAVVQEKKNYEIVVYTAQDALVGEDWLKNALLRMITTNAGLVGLHDGKWGGNLASFGMAQRSWFKKNYNGLLFHPGYLGHYADTELTQVAKQQNRYSYAEKSVMLEVDFDKIMGRGKGVVKQDKLLFQKRKRNKFDGLVTDKDLLQEFS